MGWLSFTFCVEGDGLGGSFLCFFLLLYDFKDLPGRPFFRTFLTCHFLTNFLCEFLMDVTEETNIFSRNASQCRKNWKEGLFSLARYCILRWRKEQLLCFSSACQLIHFGTLKFRRTLCNYFCQFVWVLTRRQIKDIYL